jgi:signal transduction histidine kinase
MSRVSLLSQLAYTPRLSELLPHLHESALEATGGSCSVLFELNPRNGAWYATSGFGLDEIGIEPWNPEETQRALVRETFAQKAATLITEGGGEMPHLVMRLGTPAILMIPLAQTDRQLGMLAIGFRSVPSPDADWSRAVEASHAFVAVLELSRLRQQEEIRRELQALLEEFGAALSKTLNLSSGLDVFCQGARRLFAAERASVWIHDRVGHSLVLHASSDPPHVARGIRIDTEDVHAPAALGMRRSRAEMAPTGGDIPTSTLTVPLRGRRRALGTVVFEGVFLQAGGELDLLDRADELGFAISGSIENLQLLEDVIRARRELESSGLMPSQMRTEAERQEMQRKLTQSDKLAALGQLIAGIAHELNNPLQSVLGHLELLRATGAFPPPIRHQVQTIYREADRAAKIVRNLLVFAGSHRLVRRRVSLHAVLQKVLMLRAQACRTLHIEVVRHYDRDLPRVQSDPLLLHQAFLNIVMNAEQAIAATGRPGCIEVTTSAINGRVLASVRDTGNGIPDDTMARIFEPFYTTKEVGKGTGLGLAITYGIVQEHGGHVSAANHPDGGAVVTIELPVSQKPAPAAVRDTHD